MICIAIRVMENIYTYTIQPNSIFNEEKNAVRLYHKNLDEVETSVSGAAPRCTTHRRHGTEIKANL